MKTYLIVMMLCLAAGLAGCVRDGSSSGDGSQQIMVDGNGEDWVGIEPVLTDPKGDAGPFDGLDVLDISIARNAKEYVMRIRRSGTSIPSGEDMSFWVFFERVKSGPELRNYRINVSRESSGSVSARIDAVTGTEEHEEYELLSDSIGAVAKTTDIEVWWPPALMPAGTYQIRFMCHSTKAKEWEPTADQDEDRPPPGFTVYIDT